MTTTTQTGYEIFEDKGIDFAFHQFAIFRQDRINEAEAAMKQAIEDAMSEYDACVQSANDHEARRRQLWRKAHGG